MEWLALVFAGVGGGLTLTAFTAFTLRIEAFKGMLFRHFVVYFGCTAASCWYLEVSPGTNAILGIFGFLGAGFWWSLLKLFIRIEAKQGL